MTERNCENCKYDYDRWCVERGFNQRDRNACKDCPVYIEAAEDCYCIMTAGHDCPYYESVEEE